MNTPKPIPPPTKPAAGSDGRSPAYPYVTLQEAVRLTGEAYAYAKRSEANLDGLYKHWGYAGATGSSKKTLAALKYFGLIDQAHGSPNVRLSDRGLRIVLDREGSKERADAIRDAFLSPKLYRYCWDLWGNDLPHDDAIRSHLIFEKGFNASTVAGFIEDYKQSMIYSGIAQSGTLDNIPPPGDTDPQIEVGDTIQWESQGVIQFERKAVRGRSDDGQWVFVEGSATGIPVAEVTLIEKGVKTPPPAVSPPTMPLPGVTTQHGEREWLRGPLSKDASYRIVVSGDLGPKELGKLIKLLEAQKLVLEDDDEETAS